MKDQAAALAEVTESMKSVSVKADEENVVVALFAISEALHVLSLSLERIAEELVTVTQVEETRVTR